jgi:hypothetical protein
VPVAVLSAVLTGRSRSSQEGRATACHASGYAPYAAGDDRRPEVVCCGFDLTLLTADLRWSVVDLILLF